MTTVVAAVVCSVVAVIIVLACFFCKRHLSIKMLDYQKSGLQNAEVKTQQEAAGKETPGQETPDLEAGVVDKNSDSKDTENKDLETDAYPNNNLQSQYQRQRASICTLRSTVTMLNSEKQHQAILIDGEQYDT